MTKKQQNKTVWPEKASPAAGYYAAATCPQKRKRKRRKKKKKIDQNQMEEKMKKQYLVIRHAARDPSYSLVELNHTEQTPEHPAPFFPNRVACFDGEFNMGFAAVSTSDGRSWIVGVGGFPGRVDDGGPLEPPETVVFDCETAAVGKGPPPISPKYLPLAFAVGDRVYALSRIPNIWAPFDAPPWFEVLDLSAAAFPAGGGGGGRLTGCGSWRALPPPPLFPALPDETELDRLDHAPWTARIESYAVLGRRYILLSAAAGDPVAGTVAFDVSSEEWHFVDRERSLPFVGEGVPYGRRLFLGKSRSKESRDLAAYDMSLRKKKKGGGDWTLAITEVPLTIVRAGDSPMISRQFFSCLGNNGVLCGTGCSSDGAPHGHEIDDDEVHIHLYRPVVVSAEEGDEAAGAEQVGTVLSSEGSWYILKLHEPLYRLVTPTLVAAPCVAI
ncbi:unnamed protein product [Urochloa humidicola]